MPHRTYPYLIITHGKQVAMSFIVAYNFLEREGKEALDRMKARSNKKRSKKGKDKVLKEIAEGLGISVQRASKLRSQLLEQQWVYSQETRDALELRKRKAEDEAKEADEMLRNDKILAFKEKRQA